MSARLISIIGPPAVGKTTMAEALAGELSAQLVREDYAGNPFLSASYAGQQQAQLPAQLYFLMSRVCQLAVATWPDEGAVVSDYGFLQDDIFAQVRLGDDDYRLYKRVASRVDDLVHRADVIVHLEAEPHTLLRRIANRGRDFEKAMTADFLKRMSLMYNAAVEEADCPVIGVDCDQCDLRRPADFAAFVAQVKQYI